MNLNNIKSNNNLSNEARLIVNTYKFLEEKGYKPNNIFKLSLSQNEIGCILDEISFVTIIKNAFDELISLGVISEYTTELSQDGREVLFVFS